MYVNIPAPLPDECLRGYGFRVYASNANDLLTANQLLPTLSNACGLSLPHLVTSHTHLAYARFAHFSYGYLDLNNHPDLVSNRNIRSGKTPINNARYCPDCKNEDLDLHGLSYWHRIHHLPGVDHCIKHDASLIITNFDDDHTQQPSTASIVKTAIPKNRLASYFQSDHIKKFTHLSAATLEMGLSFEYFVIRNALINRYNKLKHGPYFDLAKIAYQKFPPFWLNKLFFEIDSNRIPPKPEKIFEALKNHSTIKPIKAYLILMALFWRDPREAIRECLLEYYSRPLDDGRLYFLKNKYKQY